MASRVLAGIPPAFSQSTETGPARHVRTLNRFQERPLSSIGILLGRVGILVGSNSQKTCKTVYKKDLRLLFEVKK